MTIDYYNNHADEFIQNTVDVDMSSFYQKFLSYIPTDGSILDAGCGSGRDIKYFLEQGYQVDAYDASETLATKASLYTGIEVLTDTFQSFEPQRNYDGIWACASLLHVPNEELLSVLQRLLCQLKPNGILYFSMKYGHGSHHRNGRMFTDLNEQGLKELLETISTATGLAVWTTEDKRPDRDEKWLNAIVQHDIY